MDDGPWPTIWGVLTVLAFILVALRRRREGGIRQARERSLQRWASDMGFEFDPRPIEKYDLRHGHTWFRPPLDHVGWARHIVTGRLGVGDTACPLTLGDYATQPPTYGPGEHAYNQGSFLLVDLPWAAVPDLLIRPAKLGDGARSALGAEDLDVGTRSFSDRYVVQCSDPDFARALVTPALAMFLDAGEPTSVEIVYDELLVTSATGRWVRWDPKLFPERVVWTRRFLELWPKRALAMLAPKESAGPAAPGDPAPM